MRKVHILLFFMLTRVTVVYSTVSDTTLIKPFEKSNSIQLYSGIYKTTFRFAGNHLHETNGFKLSANSSAYSGINLNYRFLSLYYEWNIPHTYLDNKAPDVKSLYFQLFQFGRAWGIEGIYQKYSGLIHPQSKHHFDPYRNIDYMNTGLNAYYFFQHRKFSFRSASFYSEKQTQSSGSPVLMLTPSWQKFLFAKDTSQLKNEVAGTILQHKPGWLSLLPRFGYVYNFVMNKGEWNVSPGIFAGWGLKQDHINKSNTWQPVTSIQLRLNAGYNGNHWFCYVSGYYDQTNNQLPFHWIKTRNEDFSFTTGYRFSKWKHKILGII